MRIGRALGTNRLARSAPESRFARPLERSSAGLRTIDSEVAPYRRHEVRGGLWAFPYLALRRVLELVLVLLRSENTNTPDRVFGPYGTDLAISRRGNSSRSPIRPASRCLRGDEAVRRSSPNLTSRYHDAKTARSKFCCPTPTYARLITAVAPGHPISCA